MIRSTQLKRTTSVSLVIIAASAFLPELRAAPQVAPAPDGCYPNFTTAEGCNALAGLGIGAGNTGVGWFALFSAGASNFNTGVGAGALALNTADSNTAVGAAALLLNATGPENTAVGTNALLHNVDGDSNTAVGAFALANENATGGFPNGVSNNAIGRQALFSDTTGSFNQAMGVNALLDNTTGSGNIAIGDDALINNVDASGNIAVGGGAMFNNAHGAQNTVVGSAAGQNLVAAGSDGNIYIGAGAGGPSDEVAFIRIGTPTIEGFPYDTYIAGIFDRDVDAATAVAVFADTNQKIGTNLVDANGNRVPFKPQAMLDESLKQQKRIAELEAIVERQQKGMEVLTAQLKEQAAQIQKVSVQLELNKPAPQSVLNSH